MHPNFCPSPGWVGAHCPSLHHALTGVDSPVSHLASFFCKIFLFWIQSSMYLTPAPKASTGMQGAKMSQAPDWLGCRDHPIPSTCWLWHHSQDWVLPGTPAMRGPEIQVLHCSLSSAISVLPSFHSGPSVTSLQPLGAEQNRHYPSMGWVSLEGSGRSCNAMWEITMPESWERGVEACCRVKRLFSPSDNIVPACGYESMHLRVEC